MQLLCSNYFEKKNILYNIFCVCVWSLCCFIHYPSISVVYRRITVWILSVSTYVDSLYISCVCISCIHIFSKSTPAVFTHVYCVCTSCGYICWLSLFLLCLCMSTVSTSPVSLYLPFLRL